MEHDSHFEEDAGRCDATLFDGMDGRHAGQCVAVRFIVHLHERRLILTPHFSPPDADATIRELLGVLRQAIQELRIRAYT